MVDRSNVTDPDSLSQQQGVRRRISPGQQNRNRNRRDDRVVMQEHLDADLSSMALVRNVDYEDSELPMKGSLIGHNKGANKRRNRNSGERIPGQSRSALGYSDSHKNRNSPASMIEIHPAHPMYAGSSMSKEINDNTSSKDTELNMQSRTPVLPDLGKQFLLVFVVLQPQPDIYPFQIYND